MQWSLLNCSGAEQALSRGWSVSLSVGLVCFKKMIKFVSTKKIYL